MNKIILLIDPIVYVYERIKEIAESNDDYCYVITSEDTLPSDKNVFIYNCKKSLEETINFIDEKIGKPNLIFTTNENSMTQTHLLSEHYGTIDLHTHADIVRDKNKLKNYLKKNSNINQSKHQFFTKYSDISFEEERFQYPLIVKPKSGFCSCGVKKVKNDEELKSQIKKISRLNATVISFENIDIKGFIIEEYIDGHEYSIDTLWKDGKKVYSKILCRENNNHKTYFLDKLYLSNPNLKEDLKGILETANLEVVKTLGIKNGFTHAEFKVKNANKPYLIEIAHRPGAGGLFFKMFDKQYNVDFLELFYSYFVNNNESKIMEDIDGAYYFWYVIEPSGEGIVEKVEGIDLLNDEPNIIDVFYIDKVGKRIYAEEMNTNYFCTLIGKLDSHINIDKIDGILKKYDDMISITYRKS